MPKPELDAPAQRILEVASRLLSAEGPEALSNRRVAREAGCTTMTIYIIKQVGKVIDGR